MNEAAAAAARRESAYGVRLLAAWQRLERLPGGRWLFSWMVGRFAPYTGTLRARVTRLEPGRAEVRMRDRRRTRNHLRSVHAVALANLGELASGLAAVTAMPAGVRGIPTSMHVDYLTKARGMLHVIGTAALPDIEPGAQSAAEAHAEIRNAAGEVVAIIRVAWRVERVGKVA